MASFIETPSSSMFSGYSYDAVTWILTLTFKNGKIFEYVDFSPEDYDEFCAAKSLGGYYNSSIKGRHESRDVTAAPAPTPVKEQLKASLTQADYDGITETIKSASVDLGITDADIRLAHPGYKPAAEVKAEADIITPDEQETLQDPARKQPQVDKLTKQWTALVPTPVAAVVVRDKAHYVQVSELLKKKTGLRDMVFNLLDPVRDAVYRTYQQIQQRQKSIIDPMDASIKADKAALTAWDNEQQRIAAEAQRKADAEAKVKAEEDQRRRTEELRLQVAEQQASNGDTDAAEASLFDEAIQAPPVYTPPTRVEVETPKIEGQSYRDNWSARVTDFEALVLDVAAGIEHYRKTSTLGGHAPTSVLTFSQPNLNQLAKANKSMLSIPGLVAENNRILTSRRG